MQLLIKMSLMCLHIMSSWAQSCFIKESSHHQKRPPPKKKLYIIYKVKAIIQTPGMNKNLINLTDPLCQNTASATEYVPDRHCMYNITL